MSEALNLAKIESPEDIPEGWRIEDDKAAEWCVQKMREAEADKEFWKNHFAKQLESVNRMELRLPLEMSPGREAACRAVFGTWGFFPTMHGKTALRVDFIHRLEFGEVSGHRVLIKRGPGNRGPTECGTTHEATSGMSS